MSVWKDKEGRWHAAVQRGGKRIHRICPEAATWRDAKDIEGQIRRGFANASKGRFPIGEVIQKWLEEEVAHQKAKQRTETHAYALAEWVEGRDISEIDKVAREYKNGMRSLLTGSTALTTAWKERGSRCHHSGWSFRPHRLTAHSTLANPLSDTEGLIRVAPLQPPA